jgi:hypothetical protein
MAAGQGFKTFVTGEVLTSGDVNGYLMQGINVFASTAARDAAITVPAEGQFAFTKDTNGLWYYDGAAWVASGATGDIEGVTAGVGISGGGTSGTVTVTNSMATAIDAKGDLVPGTGADTFARLAVGANDTVLTADSTQATGMKWATAGGASNPSFSVFRTTDQTVTANTYTKVAFTSEAWDTDNCFDSTTNYRFTPTVAGKYLIQFCIIGSGTANYGVLYFNGSRVKGLGQAGSGATANGSTILSFNGTSDYVEFFAYLTSGTTITGTAEYTYATGAWFRS